MVKIGIVGGTGYTGSELLRLLVKHPAAQVQAISSRSEAGRAVADLFPSLRGHLNLSFGEPEVCGFRDCDLVFFATPNGTAMHMVPELLAEGVRVVDLAADFRLKDASEWSYWYGMTHACPELISKAVYGLPELYREGIKGARLVANPGCYPTAVTLGLLPLVEVGAVDLGTLIADAKSGVSGAGRKAAVSGLMAEMGESFKAYAVGGHRHLPEIRQTLTQVAGRPVGLTFVPHLVPMVRGIEATLYGRRTEWAGEVQALYEERFAAEPFVDVLPAGSHPETRSVRGTNQCQISVSEPLGAGVIVVQSVIDNLVKGAAGQAIQNMNLMFGLEETLGLDLVSLAP